MSEREKDGEMDRDVDRNTDIDLNRFFVDLSTIFETKIASKSLPKRFWKSFE